MRIERQFLGRDSPRVAQFFWLIRSFFPFWWPLLWRPWVTGGCRIRLPRRAFRFWFCLRLAFCRKPTLDPVTEGRTKATSDATSGTWLTPSQGERNGDVTSFTISGLHVSSALVALRHVLYVLILILSPPCPSKAPRHMGGFGFHLRSTGLIPASSGQCLLILSIA